MCFGKWNVDGESGYSKHGTYEQCPLLKSKDGGKDDDRDR